MVKSLLWLGIVWEEQTASQLFLQIDVAARVVTIKSVAWAARVVTIKWLGIVWEEQTASEERLVVKVGRSGFSPYF